MNQIKEQKEYKVLARKYRPLNFSDLIGQDTLVQTLTNAISINRIAHAYLLTGVRGVGKTTTARLIAMSLNCEKRKEENFEPCNECESCLYNAFTMQSTFQTYILNLLHSMDPGLYLK